MAARRWRINFRIQLDCCAFGYLWPGLLFAHFAERWRGAVSEAWCIGSFISSFTLVRVAETTGLQPWSKVQDLLVVTVKNEPSALWTPERRSFTIGMLLIVTLAAFEAMGLSTALPTLVRELEGQQWYSWPFTVFMAASAIGTVLSGQIADRRGPALPLLLAMPSFAVGLLIAGLAPNMAILLLARALQGLAGGTQVVALYVLIARVFPERHRPAAFGALSAAWVVPALLGPTIAGLLTEYVSWRWVFLGLAPLVFLGAVLVMPTVRSLGQAPDTPAAPRRGLPLAAIGAAVGVVTVTWSAQNPSWLSLFVGLAAVMVLIPSMRVLVPSGTLLGKPGIPVMVLSRGLLAGVFFSAQAFVPLILSSVHDYSAAVAGIPLTVGSLGWSLGAWWQSRQPSLRRESMVALGFLFVATAVSGLTLVAPSWGPHWLIFLLWFLAGMGMGISMASTSVRVLGLSADTQRGFNSAALQISDMLGQATLVGLGGVLVTALATTRNPTSGVIALDLLLAAIAVLAATRVYRAGLADLR